MSDERAQIQFEDGTHQSYKDLVEQTLEQSEFIETEWVGEQLVLNEPTDEERDNA